MYAIEGGFRAAPCFDGRGVESGVVSSCQAIDAINHFFTIGQTCPKMDQMIEDSRIR